ncbi:hypothetical protein MIMGU_mgv11b018141mg [Erythranthe guttata]|uniref:R13L1/DRL21-like LRR repeat region domain-containing protein n=1 Tax=Erythranthe guttata TaxID=4155 RepID=A0A022RKL8_ERYGU|nr:hypothetical protein MIMGU_mgv11b018141mg [Erythranthe guttata]
MSELNNLMEIGLRNCKECEQIPMLGHLRHLKNLYLHGMSNVKSIGSSFYGIDKCSRSGNTITIFPALERLELVCMWKLTEWLEAELMPNATDNRRLSQLVLVFPRLEYVKIIMCMQLESAPSHFRCLKELEISQAHSELPLAKLPDDLHSLNALDILSIRDCPNLMAIPYPHESHDEQQLLLLGLSCLRELSIHLPISDVKSNKATRRRF